MRELQNFMTSLHQSTARNYLARMNDDKVACMVKAKQYEADYWDGDRRFGYGGYVFQPSRWRPVAKALISAYGLTSASSVLDVGCGKGFLLYELQLLQPGMRLEGFDVSNYALSNQHPDFHGVTFRHKAQELFPYKDDEFDLVISLATLHNLRLPEIEIALSEIERTSRQAYVMVESYRNELEMFNLECWALTAESLLHPEEWQWLFHKLRYSGDYEFIYFE
jgi:ubiquinone/menaquinone biosynthesis C-methylase UbiE